MKTPERFTNFCIKLFKSLGYEVVKASDLDKGYDFAYGTSDHLIYAAEVKFYRSEHAQTGLIIRALQALSYHASKNGFQHGLLIVSATVNKGAKANLEKKFGITIIDQDDLFNLVSNKVALQKELENILESHEIIEQTTSLQKLEKIIDSIHQESVKIDEAKSSKIDDGEKLCKQLKNITIGREGWVDFEAKCTEILNLLFKNSLTGWKKQKPTSDGHGRYDLICRIDTKSGFWKFIASDIGSRYIVFEFKNYSKAIDQGQIYTTERYLYEKALRKAAIIITRKGVAKAAEAAIRGAMREHGKLMIALTDEDLCKMLWDYDHGNDPSDRLFEMVDEFMMTLSR